MPVAAAVKVRVAVDTPLLKVPTAVGENATVLDVAVPLSVTEPAGVAMISPFTSRAVRVITKALLRRCGEAMGAKV